MTTLTAPIEVTSSAVLVEQPDMTVRAELVTDEFINLICRDFAREHLIISQGCREGAEIIAIPTGRPMSTAIVHNVGVRLRREVQLIEAGGEAIARAIDEAYERARQNQNASNATASSDDGPPAGLASGDVNIDELLAQADKDLLSTQGKGPVVKLVDALLFEALGLSATDVHIQPSSDCTLVRYRLDGVLQTVRQISQPKHLASAIISRIKVMGRMDIAEKRLPQDGRATVTIGQRSIDLRISTLPTSCGERAVLRLLDTSQHLDDVESLGMPPEMAAKYLRCARMPNGIILVTGPTGSGKTTTLYATLKAISHPGINILTIEDPIEYDLGISGNGLSISQSQVNLRKGVNFATGLRHILRQDPDIIMVGEIRDAETARIAIQSSLTGHLVLSTLHTNDAPSAITRLIDLGVEAYLVSASLSAVLAQRLVRLVHQECRGEGCEACFNTGFQGRTGVFELLVIDEVLRQLITDRAPLAAIRSYAQKQGFRTMVDEGRRYVNEGLTTELEVQRVIMGVES